MRDQRAADYWNQHLEYNWLRKHGTSQSAANIAFFLEAAGDILRESTKPAYCDTGYIQEKIRRLTMATQFKVDWSGELSPREARALKTIRAQIQRIPETSEKVSRVKSLITAIADRDRYAVRGHLDNLPAASRLCQS